MSVCASCGLIRGDDRPLCQHHHDVAADQWAAENRVLCDFFHRGVVPRRLTLAERADPDTIIITEAQPCEP